MCGIVGIAGVMPVNQSIYDALTVLQHRGQDAAGIITIDANNCFRLRKANGLVSDVFEARHMQRMQGNMGIGHVRYPTTDAMVKWIYNFLENYPEYIKLFKHSLCPDECFFQTLVMNSPFANTTKPYLHYIKWEKGKSSPKTLTTIDYEELKKAEKLIARKFDINVDAEIIERLRMRYAE